MMDTYRNLTLKHMLAYEWTLDHCPEANFVLKADDDTFVDTIHLPTFLKSHKLGQKSDVRFYKTAPPTYPYLARIRSHAPRTHIHLI
jgi:hypothetical protein